jgi:hypothetical protein
LRAKPEPTQLEHLSDAFFLGKLLVLPANVRADWKVIARYKNSSLFGLIVSDEGKRFKTLTPDIYEKLRQMSCKSSQNSCQVKKKAKICTSKLNLKIQNISIKPFLIP